MMARYWVAVTFEVDAEDMHTAVKYVLEGITKGDLLMDATIIKVVKEG